MTLTGPPAPSDLRSIRATGFPVARKNSQKNLVVRIDPRPTRARARGKDPFSGTPCLRPKGVPLDFPRLG